MSLKQRVKKCLSFPYIWDYKAKRRKSTSSYQKWIVGEERKIPTDKISGMYHRISYSRLPSLEHNVIENIHDTDMVVLYQDKGELHERCIEWVARERAKHPRGVLFYGDEDTRIDGIRRNPWYKPEWSPDTLESFFYLGSVIAVPGSVFLKTYKQGILIYDLVWNIIQSFGLVEKAGARSRVIHCSRILFHGKDELLYKEYANHGYHEAVSSMLKERENTENKTERLKVSMIIPSKDNPKVLEACIDSVLNTTPKEDIEIIIVDNGSNLENKEKIQFMIQGKNADITYVYQEMDFNFSQMCNIGVNKSKYPTILLLNDDLTMHDQSWYKRMIYHVQKPHVGAVGMKLYYPHSHSIQHTGITNIPIGPVHKLQFQSDDEEYYFGKNRKDQNVLAVTAACLMVRKAVWQQAGGLCEELQVAFNDVDFCYTLWELGYYNVVVQDTFIYHHESLSRGKDDSVDKMNRLLAEREKLYERHPGLEGIDPFYSPKLNHLWLDTTIHPALGMEELEEFCRPIHLRQYNGNKLQENSCLQFSVEYILEHQDDYEIYGYGVVLGSDNACFCRQIVLEDTTTAHHKWIGTMKDVYRYDLEENLPDQVRVGMCGFACKISKAALPQGTYHVGIAAKDKLSGLYLYGKSNRFLSV